ncbi:LacI family DNA-binding transcriptional regulator [Cellulomonas triticagri]|uniref:LacI family DNA-binding transcriptional regulator n=1 Tax=Cellulomonas triticagri TaxID=2483352 RepID=UPI0013154627|nr:LacI family DNA-binding transcriptional regulator [Cellulomonas triticagri]
MAAATPPARPTIRDIAREAGVSVATVSRVTHDDPRVVPETKRRVQEVIDRLGYRPSALGRALSYQRTLTLGIALPGLGGPYFAQLIEGAESVAVERGVVINVVGTHLRPDAADAVRQLAERTDGLIVAGGTLSEDDVADLAASGRVVVVAGDQPGVPCVVTDGRAAAAELVRHLVEAHGHRRLRFVGEPDGSPDTAWRYAGFRDVLAERGLTEAGEPLRLGLDVRSGAVAARLLHDEGVLPDALVCGNDELATGMLATLPGLGHRIPTDVAVTGFDDQALAEIASPRLTTVHQPVADLGALAAAGALGGDLPARTTLPTRLVVRESCGCTQEGAPR